MPPVLLCWERALPMLPVLLWPPIITIIVIFVVIVIPIIRISAIISISVSVSVSVIIIIIINNNIIIIIIIIINAVRERVAAGRVPVASPAGVGFRLEM